MRNRKWKLANELIPWLRMRERMKESARIKPVRPFTKDDIPRVADMFQRLMLSEGPSMRQRAPTALPDYFEQTFFHHPWYDEAYPSLVYQESDGKLIGFIGVVTRPMLLRGQPVRTSVSFHLMVEPQSRSSMAGVQLLKTLFAGPQDLSLTDGAGEVGRRVWTGVGGTTSLLYSQLWTRILQPTRHAVDLLGARGGKFTPFARALSPFCKLTDAAAARALPNRFSHAPTQYSEEELDVETLVTHLPQFTKSAPLQPVYDEHSMRWMLAQAAQMRQYGELQKVLIRDAQHTVVGWFLYHLKPGGTSTVIQSVARKGAINELLDCLFHHARRHGAASIAGRLVPQYMQELSDKYCYFDRNCSWVLVHSNNPEILNIIHRGEAFLTGLEGECCLLF
jgi:hypothetical protein